MKKEQSVVTFHGYTFSQAGWFSELMRLSPSVNVLVFYMVKDIYNFSGVAWYW